ncbi:MAG: ABC transporter permease [Eubacteriales bacterium]
MGILIPLVVISIIIAILNPVFLSMSNIIDVLRNTSFIIIISLGMTFVLIARGLDLSVGSFVALMSLVVGLCMSAGIPVWLSIIITLLAGAVGGAFNALIIVKFNVPSLITTLGTMYMARGLVLILTQGVPIYPLPESFNAIGQESIAGIPYVLIIAVALSILFSFILRKTVYGRMVYALGGNEETARLSGIKVNLIKTAVYIVVTTLSALTGILIASRLGASQPTIGEGYEMKVIASVIIGGTSMSGGSGTILGSILGALFMSVITNGMTLVGVSVYWQNFVVGFIIILAVIIDQSKRRIKGAN